jgi:uncharacterized GH25 family protein
MPVLSVLFSFILTLIATALPAHEMWIAPDAYQIAPDDRLTANLVNGQAFEGINLPYLPRGIVNFVVFSGDDAQRVMGRPGDLPALDQDAPAEGLAVIAYQSALATVDYATWDKFASFAEHKDLGDQLARHLERGLPRDGFVETYARYSKSLVAVGAGAGADRRVGLETEIVALTNPYTDDLSEGFAVQVYDRNDLRANSQIEVFAKDPDGSVTITLHRTDDQGIARFDVTKGVTYMVDAVVLREASDAMREQTGGVWHTLWANLTFAVPQ